MVEAPAPARHGIKRLGWTVVDQGLSSASNFVMAALIAGLVTLSDFGTFGLVYSLYMFALGLSRALFTEPMLVQDRSGTGPDVTLAPSVLAASTGGALTFGGVVGLATTVLGYLMSSTLGDTFMALGIALPGLMVQDAYRLGFVAQSNPRAAALNDAAWGVVQVGLLVVARQRGVESVAVLVGLWGASGTVAAILAVFQARVRPRPSRTRAFLREHRDLAPRFAVEFAVGGGTVQSGLWVIALVAGLDVLGALRAAMTLLGPVRLLVMAAPVAAVPELTRLRRGTVRRYRRAVGLLVLVLVAANMIWGQAALLIPDSIGLAVFGDSWAAGRALLFPMSLWLAFTAAYSGIQVGLRGIEEAGRSLKARIATAPILVAGGAVGAVLAGASGAAFGRAIAAAVSTAVWIVFLRRALATWPPATANDSPDGADDVGLEPLGVAD